MTARSTHRGSFHLAPMSAVGRWAAGFVGLFVAAFLFLLVMAGMGQEGGDRLSDNWWLAVPGVTAGVSGLAALAAGVVAMVRERDRSLPVLIAVVVGMLVTVFLLGEVISPH